jgi:hypothetical protein
MFEIPEGLALFGGNCPLCGKYYTTNGVGTSELPVLTSVLNSLPSSHILRYGAAFHDWAFHMGGSWGTRKQADDLMLSKNRERIAYLKLGWIKSSFYYTMNWRNYLAVRLFGGKFWNEKGCKSQ